MQNFPANIEQWRNIDGYDNYQVSSHGRVRNSKTNRILKNSINGSGRLHVGLFQNNKAVCHKVHRLVAFAFCDNPNNHNVVDHIDNNPLNNMFTNLRWVTQCINMRNRKLGINNRSGIQCVEYDVTQDAWRARVANNDGKRLFKSFACKKYGAEQAKQMAIDQSKLWRAEFGYIED
jgi:hypothetical protein